MINHSKDGVLLFGSSLRLPYHHRSIGEIFRIASPGLGRIIQRSFTELALRLFDGDYDGRRLISIICFIYLVEHFILRLLQ